MGAAALAVLIGVNVMTSAMRMARMAVLMLLLAAGVAQAGVGPGRLAELEIYDRTTGRLLPAYWSQGRYYVAGQPGHEYELRLRSRDGARLLAVTSVDGVNVITGQTASPHQSGYVLNGYGRLSVAGWRKSMQQTAAFYFTALPDSYAARTGRPHDVGVIGIALFREAPPTRRWRDQPEIARAPSSAAESAAPSMPSAPPSTVGSTDGQARRGAGAPARSESYAQDAAPSAHERLGTGHGRNEWSSARHTQFRRASSRPDEVVTIYYDSYANLVAQGIAPPPALPSPQRPRPFPAGFVPDPR